MEESLRVILSADVSAFENAFVRATQSTRQAVEQINNNLKGASAGFDALATTTNKLIPSFGRFSAIFKGAFLREFSGDTEKAAAALGQAYSRIQQGTQTFGQLLTATQFTTREIQSLAGQISAIPVDYLETGLAKAERTLQRFTQGQRPMAELRRSIEQLQASLPGMANTAPVEKLIASLVALRDTQKGMNVVGMDITPKIHAEDTLKEVERIKGLVASQQFHFQITADSKGLQSSINQAAGVALMQSLKIQQAVSSISFKPVSTAPLAEGLNKAEAAIKKFSSGTVTVGELNRAIVGLIQAKEGLKDTTAVDKLITRLQALKIEASQLQATGIKINPTVDVSGTLRDIEKVKSLIGGQQFNFRLTADSTGLQNAMVLSVDGTRNAVSEINKTLAQAGGGFGQFALRAQRAVVDYVRALGQLNTVPTAVKTTVQAPDMGPVIQAVQKVKSEIANATVTALPKLTLSADTTPFTQALLKTKAVSQETWTSIKQTFIGVDNAIAAAAEKARVSVQQMVQNFNALKGVGPQAVVMQVQPPDYGPVIQAAKMAKRNIDQAFLSPLPSIKVPQVVPPRGLPLLTKQSNEAQFALMNLSRVAQDAPFGFIGIANNINPLLESFQQLKATSGSTGSAFKALAGSLMGPAGLGLAVGVASSLLITFGDKISLFKKKLDIFKESLGEAAKSSSEELVKLKIYADRLNDTTLTNQERIKVAKEYNKIADETNKIDLKQIDNLTILNEKIAAQTALVQQRALSAAAIGKLTDASSKYIEKELELQTQLEATGLTYEQVEKAAQAMFKRQIEGTQAVRKGLDGIRVNQPILGDKTENQIQGVSNVLISLFNQVKNGKYEFDKLAKSLQNFITIDGLTTKEGGSGKDSKTKKNVEDAFKKLADYVKNMNLKAQVDFEAVPRMQMATDWNAAFKESLKQQFDKEISIPLTLNFTPEQIKANALSSPVDKVFTDYMEKFRDAKVKFPVIDLASFVKEGGDKELQEYLQNILSQMTDFRTQVKDILSNAATDSIASFAEGIGQAIAGGNIGNAFSAVLETMGSAIMELGKQMIVGSSIIQAFKKALATLVANPAAGLAVGATMVAVGAAIKASASKIMKFEAGGIAYGPTLGLMGEYAGASSNPEVIAPLSKLKDIIGNTGGDKFPAYLPMHQISGSTLRLWYARADRQGRKYT